MDFVMKSRYWEKIWHEMLDDPKLAPLSDALKWRFTSLILVAGRVGQGGLLPQLPELAWMLRKSEDELRVELPSLAQRGLVEIVLHDGCERWFVSNYEKRQAAMSSAERMQRKRQTDRTYPQAGRSSSASSASSDSFKEKEIEEETEADICDEPSQTRHRVATADLLAQAGISRNRTTAPLWDLPPHYVAAHLETGATTGIVISRMLAGEQPPARRHNHLGDYQRVIHK